MIDRPLITIAIPTFNRAASYLPHALGCALAQTYDNIEIIVSDNCSTDETPALMARQNDSRVRYHRHEKQLIPNDNFNFCLQQARGEYFLFLLDDEAIDADFVTVCVDAMQRKSRVGIVRTGLRVIDAHNNVLYKLPNNVAGRTLAEFFLGWFAGDTALYLCNTLFRTDVLREVGFRSKHNLFQDAIAQAKVLACATRVDVQSIKASTRSHPYQMTYAARVNEWTEDALDLLDLIVSLVPEQRELVRQQGMRFFARICYSRASAVKRPTDRIRAYIHVYRDFDRRYPPSASTILASTMLYRKLRDIKRRLKGQPAWVAAG